jgi:hypothetical protein
LAGAVGNLPIADDAPGEAAAKGTAISFGQQLATEQRRKRDAEARSRPDTAYESALDFCANFAF